MGTRNLDTLMSEMKACTVANDSEKAHGEADDLLYELTCILADRLREPVHSITEAEHDQIHVILGMWEDVDKWYA